MTQPLQFLSTKTQIYNVKFSEDHLSKNDIFLIKIILFINHYKLLIRKENLSLQTSINQSSITSKIS